MQNLADQRHTPPHSRERGLLRVAVVLGALALPVLCATGCGGSGESRAGSGGSASAPASAAGAPSTPAAKTPAAGSSTASDTPQPVGSSAPTAPTSKAAMLATANALCARRSKEIAAIPDGGDSLQAIGSAASRRAAIERRALDELSALTPPDGIARDYGKLIADDALALQRTLRLSAAAKANDAEAVRSAKAASETGQLRLLVIAARTGLRGCSTG